MKLTRSEKQWERGMGSQRWSVVGGRDEERGLVAFAESVYADTLEGALDVITRRRGLTTQERRECQIVHMGPSGEVV